MMPIGLLLLIWGYLAVVSTAPTQIGSDLSTDQDRPCTSSRTGICWKKKCPFGQAYFDQRALACVCPGAPDKMIDVEQPCIFTGAEVCSKKKCLFGRAYFDHETLSCVCSDSPDVLISHPCIETVCVEGKEALYSILEDLCICSTVRDWLDGSSPPNPEAGKDEFPSPLMQMERRDQAADASQVQIHDAVPSFIPPQKPDITPDLINESLAIQPQNTATVSSIIPYFKSDIFKVFLQLGGPVADTLVVNASVSLPCGPIGLVDPEPNVALVPKIVQDGQGTNQTVVADCQVIAVNMYSPQVITYWIQKPDGTLYSVVGSNKVLDIDKMNTGLSVALALVTLPMDQKRSLPQTVELVAPEKRQIFAAHCALTCPFYHMRMIQGSDGYCGCMFKSAEQELELTARGMKEPSVHTAIMTTEACAAMTCFNDGNKPATFNRFSKTCWCYTQPLIDSNPSAWNG